MSFINLLIKPASSLCNLRCRYCFYADEAQNRAFPSMGFMTEETADCLIRQAFKAAGSDGAISFAFQGGEPTLAGLPFFRHFVEKVSEYRKQDVYQHVRIFYSIQTNGTLLTKEWAAFLGQNRFLTGLSIDGQRSLHDRYRLDADGKATWSRVLNAKSLLEEAGASCNALCVVTGPAAEDAEGVYRRLKSLGFRYQQYIACLDPIGSKKGQQEYSLTPEAYGAFLCQLFDLWFEDWARGNYHSIRLFDDYVHILLGDGASTCATCGRCGSYFVVEGDGSVYPCDFFALNKWKMGNLKEKSLAELKTSQAAERFKSLGEERSRRPVECPSCPYRQVCRGGCKNDWYSDQKGVHNYFCPSFQKLLDHAMPGLIHIARREAAYESQ